MTAEANQSANAKTRALVILRYTIAMLALAVFVGFVVGILRRIFPGPLPEHVQGQLDLGALVRLSGTVIVCLFVYWRLATRHPLEYMRLGLAIAVLTGVGNFFLNAVLVPAGVSQLQVWLIVATVGVHVAIMVFAGLLFGPLRRVRKVA